jgi:Flp pilus assembly protein TadG
MKRARVGEEGQALVELAFVIPLVVLFLFGIIDFGLALNQKNSETNVANFAVRQAAVVTSTAQTVTCAGVGYTTLGTWAACEATAAGEPSSTVCVGDFKNVSGSSTVPSSTYTTGDPIKVESSSNFSWLKLIQGHVSGLSSTIGADATMRYEGTLSNQTSTFLSPTCPS